MSQPTLHEKKILAALVLLDGVGSTPASRLDIARIVFDKWCGLQMKYMQRLLSMELVEPDIPEAVAMVANGRCRCGCDRWYPTKAGSDLAATFKVSLGKFARHAINKEYPFHEDQTK